MSNKIHGLSYRTVVDLCDMAYGNHSVGAGWGNLRVLRAWNNAATGLVAYKLVPANSRTDRSYIVYRGTDMATHQDWGTNIVENALGSRAVDQYVGALDIATKYGSGCLLVGHSLGGGMAAYASVYTGLPAATVFPAPLSTEGLPGGSVGSQNVYNLVCQGEILTVLGSRFRDLQNAAASNNFAEQVVSAFGTMTRDSLGIVTSTIADIFDLGSTHRMTLHRRIGVDRYVQSSARDPLFKHMLSNILV